MRKQFDDYERMKMENSIEVKNLWISYRIHKGISIKSLFAHPKDVSMEAVIALKGISFSVEQGKILGIIGKNGSGKSTLLRALAGVFSADSGIIDLHGNKVSLLSLGVGFKEELTGRENAFLSGLLLGFTLEEINKKIDSIIEFAEIGDFIDAPVKTYSSGMYSKLAFSVAVSLETEILLIDEVLSVGDENFRVRSFNRMKKLIADKRRTVVIVSHSISMLQELCDQVMWLHDGELREIGKAKDVLEHYIEFMK